MGLVHNAPFRLCMAPYRRHESWMAREIVMHCQHPKGHDGECSWQKTKDADDAEAAASARAVERAASQEDAQTLCEDIEGGVWDEWLESLLTVLHERKRTLRGTSTYRRPRPRHARPDC